MGGSDSVGDIDGLGAEGCGCTIGCLASSQFLSLKTTEFGPYSVILYDNFYDLTSVPRYFTLKLWHFFN